MVLRRIDGTPLDTVPMEDLAMAYLESAGAIIDVRIEWRSLMEIKLTFDWAGEDHRVVSQYLL